MSEANSRATATLTMYSFVRDRREESLSIFYMKSNETIFDSFQLLVYYKHTNIVISSEYLSILCRRYFSSNERR